MSITTLDPDLARVMEPRAASPERRLTTIRRLAQAGVPVGVSVSPVIPFLNEPELERILEAAQAAGATSAFSIVIRLPWEVNPLFQQWLAQHFPDRAARVMARIREMRGGVDNRSQFGERMTGSGVWAQLLRQRFLKASTRLGLQRQRVELDLTQFVRGGRAATPLPAQQNLFQGRAAADRAAQHWFTRCRGPAGQWCALRRRLCRGRSRSPVAPLARAAYLNRSLTRSVQLLALGECFSPPFFSDSSNSLSSLRWCSVSLTGVSTETWAYRSPG